MATVHYFAEMVGATNSSPLSTWMPKLQELLFAAGWTLEYADADAIGTSADPGAPAWDKGPAANTDAGAAVYRMPASSHATRWFVRVRPGWAAATTRAHMRGLQVGSAHDGSGNVTGGNSELVPSIAAMQTDNRTWYVNASEDGFFFWLGVGTTADLSVSVERVRLLAEDVQDDVIAINRFGTFLCDFVSASAGVTAFNRYLLLVASNLSSGTAVNTESLFSPHADAWLFQGPYWPVGNPLTGLPRLWRQAPLGDVSTGDTVMVNVDGGLKAYQAVSGSYNATVGLVVVATE